MAYPLVASISTASNDAQTSSLVVNNPSGLTAGDEMLLYFAWFDTTSIRSVTTPSGWTSRANTGPDFFGAAVFTKTATSGDVAAGSVTISLNGNTDFKVAALLRITGAAAGVPIADFEIDQDEAANATPSYTTALTPVSSESLVIVGFDAADDISSAVLRVSGYSAFPTIDFTELADFGLRGGGDALAMGIASGQYAGTTPITNRSATFSEVINGERHGFIIVYSAPQDAIGTPVLATGSPTFFTVAGVVGGSANLGLHQASPSTFSVVGSDTSNAVWTEQTKHSTAWNQITK